MIVLALPTERRSGSENPATRDPCQRSRACRFFLDNRKRLRLM
jgi:hypothetical protein